MPPLSHVLVEGCTFVIAAGATWDAARRGRPALMTLVAAMAFGLLVELHFVTNYAGYVYGDFLAEVAVGGRAVPLWVAAGWGSIVHTAMRASDRTHLVWWRRPALDALLALSLDLSIEVAAQSAGWWTFTPRAGSLLGVPLDNFIGWMLVVGSFSLVIRGGSRLLRRQSLATSVALPVAALCLATGFMVLARVAWGRLAVPLGAELPVFLGMVLGLSAVSLPALRAPQDGPRPWLLTAVPAGVHLVCLGLATASGDLWASPTTGVLLTVLAVSSILSFRHPRVDRAGSAQQRTAGPEPPGGA